MCVGHKNAVKSAALRDHGKTTKAEVIKLEWREKKTNHADSMYTAHVLFTPENGREMRAELGIPVGLGRALREKSVPSVMTVRYLPEAPGTLQDVNHEDSSDEQKVTGRWMLLAGLAMLIVRFLFSGRAK